MRLRAAEASLKHLNPVKRLTTSPTAAEFELTCRGFQSQPVVMPADWLPPWTKILQSPSVTEGLKGLLGDEVEPG
ncbi:unnamed protein product [Closterium sp. NIES-65]|nr:unnamed protein product [Closterium sp. NIES-65]